MAPGRAKQLNFYTSGFTPRIVNMPVLTMGNPRFFAA